MQSVDQTKSNESVLLNPEDETLNDAESFPYQKVLKETNKRIRGNNIEFKLPEFFDNNLKEFNDEPIIDNSDLLFAYKWNKKSKPFQHINGVYMVKSGKKSDFTRDEGKQYLSDLESKTWTTFDEMISSLNSIRIVKVNRENWKLSSCTCSYWLKNYYCCHSIACCYRLKLMNFNDIGMDIPLNNKPKRGAKKKTRSCLQHQPFDCIQNEENAILESDQDSDIESEPTPKSSKKQKPNDAVLSIENIL